jgi:polar amino acid transport system substrate-binding protein
MKKTILLVVLAAVFGFLTACSHSSGTYILSSPAPVLDRIEKRGEIRIGTAASMPPLNMTTKDDRIIGMEPDLARYLADSMGVTLKLQAMPFKELLPALESGKIDMILSGMTITAKRNRKVAFVGPYFISGKGILTSVATLSSIKNPNDIDKAEFKVTALAGSTSEEFVKTILPNVQYIPATDYYAAVDMVLEGKAQIMLADHPICVVAVARFPEKLFTIVSPFTYEPIGVGLPANDPLFINLVENFFNTLQASGALDNLQDKWFRKGAWWDQIK